MRQYNHKVNYYLFIISIIFILWAFFFIYQISFIAIDGQRYVNLFDDAMISMRYAWNFAHGQGLVWNPGEYIEGYTNLLMTIFMSLMIFIVDDKRLAVLIINIFGIFFMLGNAYAAMMIAHHLSQRQREAHQKWLKSLTFASILLYYPLVYWSLMGMETGLVTLLMLLGILSAFKFVVCPYQNHCFFLTIYLGLAYLTRPDAFIAALIIFFYIFYETYRLGRLRSHLKLLLIAMSLYILFIIGQQIFRWTYYGEWVPNTYVLKATGMPLLFRLQDGFSYMTPFVQSTAIAFILIGLSLIFNRRPGNLLLILLALVYFCYQIWVGGDAFPPYWRIIAPVMPLILTLAIQGAISTIVFIVETPLVKQWFSQSSGNSIDRFTGFIVSLITLVMLISMNIFFLGEMLFLLRPHEAVKNEYHVNTAISLNELTTEQATIGVSSAGIVPFYTDNRVAIDFLGKSDKYIAALPPDLSGGARYGSIFSLPGHNKYDLNYSIKILQPTYVQITGWGSQNITEWVEQRYVNVEYQGIQLYLHKDSDAVLWDKLKALEQRDESIKISDQ